ncbi:hypothetical protein BSKO_02943 [Bryopsis sp. KO-2023]|nr:hypothetical protein BSKO_02943 [Bryopsis sp. KO-2023]
MSTCHLRPIGNAASRSESSVVAPRTGAVRVSRDRSVRSPVRCEASSSNSDISRRGVLGGAVALDLARNLEFPEVSDANVVLSKRWEQVDLPISNEVVLLDLGFTETDPKHGFLLGTRQTLLETFDGGKTWTKRSIQAAVDEGFNYRFNSISFNGNEGWIVGKPAIVLHTSDGGENWERIALSSKLPGTPLLITALPGTRGQAEMITDQGAIYVTDNTAFTWKAAVQETVDATLNRTVSSGISGASYYEGFFSNVRRNPSSGDYVAVSSRGNFYMTWSPGDVYWKPRNRPAGRRVQNMGWTLDDHLWETSRGGELYFGEQKGFSEDFKQARLGSRGFGMLDVGFRSPKEGYACGGSGSLFLTEDGGKSWKRDKGADQLPANLYAIKFTNPDQGFILGNNGVLLRYLS